MGRDNSTYRFGDLTFRPATGEVEGPAHAARLAPQPALVLQALLENAGSLVTREHLHERVWPDTVVEFDKNLNFCIREVRAALGDEAASPTFIETLPRRGYRFMLPVESLEEGPKRPPGFRRPRWWHVAATVAGLMVVGAVMARPQASAYEPDPGAREAGEMGGFLLNRAQGDDVERSVDFFREAVALDPDYAKAYWGLGTAYLRLARIDEGKDALYRSLELNPRQWRAHLTLALRALYTDYQPDRAAEHFRRAVEIAPDEVSVRHSYAWWLAVSGDLRGAMKHMAAALELDPVSPRVNGDVGRLFYLAGRHDEAVAHCVRTLELTPEALRPRDCMVQALFQKGTPAEARKVALATVTAHGASGAVVEAVADGDPDEGLLAYWRWAGETITTLADRGSDSHVHAAAAWARLGDADRAFQALEAAYDVRCPVLPQIGIDPAFAAVRDDARFGAMLSRIGAAPRDS